MIAPVFEQWRKSTYSSGGGNCMEVASAANVPVVGVRDSKDPGGGTLVFSASRWNEFVRGVRDGEFDLR